jgi:phage terminase large subunit-like protein
MMANPNYGTSISPEYLEKELQKAKDQPSYRNVWKRYHLNIFVEKSAERWIDMEKWKKNYHLYKKEDLHKIPVYAGLDIASKSDLTSLCLIANKNGKILTRNYYWIPEENVQKIINDDKVPLDKWIEEEYLETAPGNVLDSRYLTDRIIEIAREHNIRHLCFDPAFSYDISPRLQEEGIEISEFRQNLSTYTVPCLELEKLYLSGELVHDNNPITNWCASNVNLFRAQDGRCKPEKDYKSSKNRIDGISSMLFAIQAKIIAGSGENENIDYSDFPLDFRSSWGI